MALYSGTKDWQPDRLLFQSGDLPADVAPGVVTAIVPNIVLAPGNFLTAFTSDGTPNFRALNAPFPGNAINNVIGGNFQADKWEIGGSYLPFPFVGEQWNGVSYANAGLLYWIFLTVATQ